MYDCRLDLGQSLTHSASLWIVYSKVKFSYIRPMPPSRMSYEERKRHRAQFYAKHKNVKRPGYNSDSSFFNFEFSAKKMKLISPYAVMIFLFTILFGSYALLNFMADHVFTTNIIIDQKPIGKITIPKDNKIYVFDVAQTFTFASTPQYSELELEILDKNHKHVYSVYKDLWMERHPNGDGGTSVYSDLKMNFELEFEKKGTYFIRPISHNGNLSPINVSIETRTLGGGLYFGFYAITFLVLSLILFFGKDYWGSPRDLLEACPSINELRYNKRFLIVFSTVSLVFLSCIVISLTHYGYPSCGDKTILPTKFLSTNNLIYLG